ncbi:Fe-S cluster assembly protein SufD [Lutibaculum baratangense]|uniref:Iron-sulfur cluster assembly protein SufD n=1 Tax=Lutibaculum baratangense AMV1 TaxID=631454 RepID=V4RIC6_9HYPH|nr:Fe-S cluster assembly protein SufD [Lutibaculum baratangense]ESR25094.1 Iron-sulfur cluster assembly protein SufD [Lutibaculum baratangense AMV1]
MNVELKKVATAAERAAAEQFERLAGDLPGGERARAARRAAAERFAVTGLPHRRIEEWKYTDLRTMLRELPPPAARTAGGELEVETLAELDAYRIVMRDGGEAEIAADLAQVAGLEVTPLSAGLDNGEIAPALLDGWPDAAASAVFDLNTAFMRGGVVIRVTAGTKLDKPIMLSHIVSHLEPSANYLRNLVVLEAGTEATVVETFEGPAGSAYLVNSVTRFAVAEGGKLDWLKVQADGAGSTHLSTLAGDVANGAEILCLPFSTGSAVSRNNIVLTLAGPDTTANIAGVQLLAGQQHGDITMFVDHAVPDCASRELFKAVLDDRARGVFQGKILVRQKAQKTDGKMMTQALMLSDDAEMDNKPELEIFADDVQCGHGATTGQIDEDLLFYLRSRGIPETQAKALLIEAFIGEALDLVKNEAVREVLSGYAHVWVAERKDEGHL